MRVGIFDGGMRLSADYQWDIPENTY